MRNKVKLTIEQLNSMYEYSKNLSFGGGNGKKDLKFYYHPLKPNNIFIKYKSYSIEQDGSIFSEIEVMCIDRSGKIDSCANDFDNLKQRMEFESDFIEIDLDANGNIIFL